MHAHRTSRITLMASATALTLVLVALTALPSLAARGKIHLTEAIKQVPPRAPLYDQDVQPLTMQQCAQCHIGVFKKLKQEGKKHQLECTFCHEVYHTFAPGKVEYANAIPKCGKCHGQPHGDKPEVSTCQSCHSNAHSPVNLPSITAGQCQMCHAGPPQALKANPSKHTEVACTDCHTTHGLIPSCFACHSEQGGAPFHLTGVQPNVCLGCHPVHTPTMIKYDANTPQNFCAPCHKNPSHARVLEVVRKANSKHNTKVTCAGCHDQHGKIPSCFKCHDKEGHRKGIDDAGCLRCHTNPHDPLNLTFSPQEPKESCAGCHGKVYDDLMKSNTRHTKQTCTLCHPRHGEIPQCQKCHGVPHGEAMLGQFGGKCGSCHGIAHNVQGRMKAKPEAKK